jgi:acetolactate synthase-1/2/3 large subunit
MKLRLADYVVRFVRNLGVRHVFLVPGGGAMHLNDALSRCAELEPVCNLHEQASAIATESYSKATNHFGVCMVTTGPGATNAITGLAGAWLDSTPCLFISGQVKRADRLVSSEGLHSGVRQMGVQEIDIVEIIKPLTKYAVTLDQPESIRYHLERAVWEAQSGRPGPVWIDIPLDVQAIQIEEGALPGFTPPATPDAAPDISTIIEALNRSSRPIILAGNGIRLAHAEREFLELAGILNVPVETTWLAIDLLPAGHPLFVGRPGSLASRGSNFAIQNSDFMMSIGSRLDRVITGYAPDRFARAAKKVMVDVDAAELAKMGDSIHHKICCDAGVFIRALLARRNEIAQRDRSDWLTRCSQWKTRYPIVTDEHRKPSGGVSVYHLAEILAAELRENDWIVSGSSGSAIELFLFAFEVKRGQRVFHTTALGSMGFGIPASIGACLANERRQVVCVEGDGSLQFNIQELETVRRLGLPIKFFVLNNEGYASIRISQTAFFGEPRIGCDAKTGQTLPDVRKVAEAYGIQTAIIDGQANLRAEIRRVLDLPGPVVCDVQVIPEEVRAPRLASVQRPDGSFVSKPLEDLAPFLERAEFLENMIIPPLPE